MSIRVQRYTYKISDAVSQIDASNVFQYVDASGKLGTVEASTQSNKVALTGNLVSTRVSESFVTRHCMRVYSPTV
jgi:hypothetical protein